MRIGTGFLSLLLVSMLVAPASAVLSITNGNFATFTAGFTEASPGVLAYDQYGRALNAQASPDGWYTSDLTGGGVADPLQDSVIAQYPTNFDVNNDGLFDHDTNGDGTADAYANGGWTNQAISVWQWWNGDNSREDGWFYQPLGAYSGEAALTLTARGFRLPSGDVFGNFTVEFWYVPSATPFTSADESDIASATGATLIGSELIDMWIDTTDYNGEPINSTQLFAGSGIANGDQVYLKIGDGPDLPPFIDHDFPVLDDFVLSTRVPGDVNNDGDVDAFDLDTIQTNFGQSLTNVAQGDIYDDGIIDLKDFVVWREWYPYPGAGSGASAPNAGGGSNVPEPTSVVLLMLGGLLALAAKRR